MKLLLALVALPLTSTAHGRVTEYCPRPTDITFAEGGYHASGQAAGSRWSGTPSPGGRGNVLDFMDAEFHAVMVNPGVTFGFFQGCTYRLASGTVLMKYEGGTSPLRFLLVPHAWRAMSHGSWLYTCSRHRKNCPFATD